MDRYVTIYDWMLELGLTGSEVAALAVITHREAREVGERPEAMRL